MDTRVETQRYTYIARRESEYMQVEQRFININKFLEDNINGVKQYERDMYSIANDYENGLFADIFSIVKKSLTIDKNALKDKQQEE